MDTSISANFAFHFIGKKILFLLLFLYFSQTDTKAQDTLNVFFQSGSFDVEEASQKKIEKWLEIITPQSQDSFVLIGFTDSLGSMDFNKKLALNRANSVKSILIASNVRDSAIARVEGKGEMSPLSTNETEEGRSQNRRVSIVHYTFEQKMAMIEQASRGLSRGASPDSVTALQPDSLMEVEEVVKCQEVKKTIEAESGVKLELEPCCFETYGDSVRLSIKTYFSREEMLLSGMPTMDIDGDCLEADAMVVVQLLDNDNKPAKLPKECMSLRMPATEQDPDKRIYFAIFGQDSAKFAWQNTYKTPVFDKEENFYKVDLSDSKAVAIQKITPDSRKYRHEPKIWIDLKPFNKRQADVYLSSEQSVLMGIWREEHACYFRQGCIADHEAWLTIIVKDPEIKGALVLNKPLKTIKVKGKGEKARYIVRKTDLTEVKNWESLADFIKFN
jgi:hypothetical protein